MTSVSSTTEVSNHYYVATPIRWGYRLCTNLTGKLSTPSSRLFKFLGIATVISLVYVYTVYRSKKPPKEDPSISFVKPQLQPRLDESSPLIILEKSQPKDEKSETLTEYEKAVLKFFKNKIESNGGKPFSFQFSYVSAKPDKIMLSNESEQLLDKLTTKKYISSWVRTERSYYYKITPSESFIEDVKKGLT